jgi:hypothetical protein
VQLKRLDSSEGFGFIIKRAIVIVIKLLCISTGGS